MDRQTLDRQGAREGEISAATLQFGGYTVAIQQIVTLAIEAHSFKPWDTPANRQTQSVYATISVATLFFGLVALAWWQIAVGQGSGVIALMIGGVLLLLGTMLGIRAAMIALKMKRTEPYFGLTIGTSDTTKTQLVDNSRPVLEKIRDVLRHKMDTGDTQITGVFDLNADIVNLKTPNGSRPVVVGSDVKPPPAIVPAPADQTPPAAEA